MKLGVRRRRRGMLDKVLSRKRAEVARMRAAPPLPPRRAPGGGVLEALRRDPGAPPRRIVEAAGPADAPADAAMILVRSEEAAARGPAALAEPPRGRGLAALAACRDALEASLGASRPRLLWEDFVVDAIQLDRAADAGADAVLLVARIVTAERLEALAEAARRLGVAPIVEVAAEAEVAAALAAGAAALAAGGRDRDTLRLDPERAAAVLGAAPAGAARVWLGGARPEIDVSAEVIARSDGAEGEAAGG